jgi:thiamine kinase-like enzyme
LEEWVATVGLQRHGNYWHLATRPDEHSSMSSRGWEGRLKRAAKAIDRCLQRDKMQCLIHGDPKSENIMIMTTKSTTTTSSASPSSSSSKLPAAAFYDFQYCGQGTPTQDLAYFLCSTCDIENDEDELVTYYHSRLVNELQVRIDESLSSSAMQNKSTKTAAEGDIIPSLDHLKHSLNIAYADYCRFMSGWGYWGTSSSDVQQRTMSWLHWIDGGQDLGSEEAYDEAIRKYYW